MTQQNQAKINIHMIDILKVYHRLLVDICELSGVPLGAPDNVTSEWVLKEAPLLDKQCLSYIEGTRLEKPELPQWLLPLWDAFIVKNDARLLRLLRCSLLFCYKIEFEPTNEQIKDAQGVFEETDEGCGVWNSAQKAGYHALLLRTARQMVSLVIQRVNWQEIAPSHGPGSVFPSCDPSEKSNFLTYYPSIQKHYPYDKYLWSLPSFWADIMVNESKGCVKEEMDIVAKLVCVPKDSRGPRLICVHPKEAIWIQQGQRKLLEAAIEASSLTRGRIAFTDQTVNGSMALESSKTKEFVTLDLKEASDRISCELIRSLFGDYVYDIISCSRANKVQLLDGRVIELLKWAPMGNCLTFPVQSLVFYTLVRAGIQLRYGVICDDVYVFGDDILFPTQYYDGALSALIIAGCVPNISKTFKNGFFRESCGVDAYNGVDVTPHRMRKADVSSAQNALATSTLAKRLRLDGFVYCSAYLYACLDQAWGPLPLSNNPHSQGIYEYVRYSYLTLIIMRRNLRFSKNLHVHQVQMFQVGALIEERLSDDWYHLLDSLTRVTSLRGWFSDRGTEYTVPHRTLLKRGWTDILR